MVSRIATFIIMSALTALPALAFEKNQPLIEVEYRTVDADGSVDALLPVSLIINDLRPTEAWLDVSDNFKLIFANQSETLVDVADALKTMAPGRSLRFTCAESSLEFCKRYKFFSFGFDYDTGKFIVIYELNEARSYALDSEPALVLRQSMSMSESVGAATYRRGNWNGDIVVGATQDARLISGLEYDFHTKKIVPSTVGYEHDINDAYILSLYQTNATPYALLGLGVKSIRGIGLTFDNSKRAGASGYYEPLVLDAAYTSIINVYDDNRKLIRSLQATQGLNRIELPNNLVTSRVKIEEVVDGRVLKSYEQVLNRFGDLGRKLQLDAGVAKLQSRGQYRSRDSETMTKSAKEQMYVSLDQGFKSTKLGLTIFPELNWFTTRFNYTGVEGLSAGLDSTFQRSSRTHSARVGYNVNLGGINYYIATNKRFADDKVTSYSFNASKAIFESSRVEFQYTQTKSLRVYHSENKDRYYDEEKIASRPSFVKKFKSESEYKRIGLKFSSFLNSSVGRFDYFLYGSTDLKNDRRVGISVSFVPESKSTSFRPTIGVELNRDKVTTSVQNQMSFSDSLTVTPEIKFTNGDMNQYGSSFSYENEYLNASGSVNKQASEGHNLFVNGSSYLFFSRYGLVSRSTEKNVAYAFKNEADVTGQAEPIEFSINGVDKSIKDGDVFYSNNVNGKVSIYSGFDGVALDPTYASAYLKPYRLYHVNYKHETNKILVSGRVLKGVNPVSGVAVVNHAGRTVSDALGYFSLTVSRQNPVISLYSGGRECHKEIPNVLKNFKPDSNQVYLGRLQCVL